MKVILEVKFRRNIFLWLYASVLMIILPSIAISQNLSNKELEDVIVIIEDEIFDQKFESAIKRIDKLLKKHKTSRLYKLKGDAIAQHNFKFKMNSLTYEKAKLCYDEAIRIEPKYFDALYARSNLNFTHQYFPEALNDASNALKHATNKKDGVDILNFRALLFTYMSDFDNAIKDYKDVLILNPDYDMAYSNLSMLYGNKGEFEKALDLQLKAIELNPEELKYYNNLGLIYIDLEEFEKADSLFSENMSKLNIPDAYLFNNRGYARIKLGKLELAEIDIRQSIDLQPDNSYAFRNLALLYIEKNQIEGICQNLEKAIQLNFTLTYGNEVEMLKEKYCK